MSRLFVSLLIFLNTPELSTARKQSFVANKLAPKVSSSDEIVSQMVELRGGSLWAPAGYHPFGYKLTPLGEEFLLTEGSRECDVGRFLASLKSTLTGSRKTTATIKSEWLELVRYAKTQEASRIYRTLDALLVFVLKCGFIA